jgi:hypothetical protein
MIATLALALTLGSPLVSPPRAWVDDEALAAVEALRSDFQEAMDAFWKAYGETPEEERSEFLANDRPDPDEYAQLFLDLAREHPATEAAAGSYSWVVQNAQDEDVVGKALKTLLDAHIESPEIARITGTLERRLGDGVPYLTKILEASPDETVRGQACYSLGKNLLSQASMTRRLGPMSDEEREVYRSNLGSAFERILAGDADATEKEAEEYFERVIVDFPDGEHWRGTLAQAAEGDLFQIRNLGTGMVAPDIEGEDIEGVPFKLSDYRGKVVVLDFWGHW